MITIGYQQFGAFSANLLEHTEKCTLAEKMDFCAFDMLFAKSVPHILEKIFLSLDWKSLKKCFEVSKTWHVLLTSEPLQMKVRTLFLLVGMVKRMLSSARSSMIKEQI